MPQGPTALSTNTYEVTLKNRLRQPVPNSVQTLPAIVTLTVVDPLGVTQLSAVTVPYISGSAGLYQYRASPDKTPIPGTYVATWDAVNPNPGDDAVWHHVETFIVDA